MLPLRCFVLLGWVWALPLTAAADGGAPCPAPQPVTELRLTLEEAEARYTDLDLDAFQERMAAADQVIRCLGEPIPRADAARYHRLSGLDASADQREEAAREAFAAARSIEPSASLPTRLVPEGHPLQQLYDAAQVDPRTEALLPPANGYLLLDGDRNEDRPLARPVIFQHVASDGEVLLSTLLLSNERTPSYPPAPNGQDLGQGRGGSRGRLLVGASLTGVGMVVGATGFALNRVARSNYDAGEQTTATQLEEDRAAVNRTGTLTLVGAGLAIAGGTVLFTWKL